MHRCDYGRSSLILCTLVLVRIQNATNHVSILRVDYWATRLFKRRLDMAKDRRPVLRLLV